MIKENMVPSRWVLNDAERTNEERGNENLGFLSEEFGFLPKNLPLTSLPESHIAWDQVASELPKNYETATIRKTFKNLPLINADEKNLDDRYVFRAATLLGMFAHCYYWLEPTPPPYFPAAIMEPWKQISRRLNKPGPFFSYSELVLYNWQLANKENPSRVLDNLRLLVKSVGKREEEVFYLSMVEMVSVSAPMVGSVVRAQEAIVRHDIEALINELVLMNTCADLVNKAFSKIDLNPYSPTYVDPVVWGRCVAILLVPWDSYGVKGPSGTASPYFHLLDTILERKRFGSMHGQNQIHYKQVYNSTHVQNFLLAIEKIPIRSFVTKSNNSTLKGAFYQLMETYAGETGLLGIHQRKAYGYSSTVFKIGRTETTAGSTTSCPFVDRVWNEVDKGLLESWEERDVGVGFNPPTACLREAIPCNESGSATYLSLDIAHQGIGYQPGDRCGILSENSDALIEKTLKALNAQKNDTIHINKLWRSELLLRPNHSSQEKILLTTFLKYGKIRPFVRSVAQKLYEVTAVSSLKHLIDLHKEDQFELWDILSLISKEYDVTLLWKTAPWQKENLSNIVPPQEYRLYSISSNDPNLLDLTVASLQYETENIQREGTASHFIKRLSQHGNKLNKELAIKVIRPFSFSLPSDSKKPIIMFANGTGIAPFRSFLLERLLQKQVGENWLFYGVRSSQEICYKEEINEWLASGKLILNIKFSREDLQVNSTEGKLAFEKGSRGYITELIEEEKNGKKLWELMQSEKNGGKGAYIYVCGTGSFFNSVYQSLRKIFARYLGSDEKAKKFFYQLSGEKRFMQDIFTEFQPDATGIHGYKNINVSEIAHHVNQDVGIWIIIEDEVYDVTDFIYLHPGGDKTLLSYAGMDATAEYKAVKHHLDSSVTALLSLFKIGAVRQIDFGDEWGIALKEKGLDYVSLKELYQNWLSYLYLIIEMQNTQKTEAEFYEKNVFISDSIERQKFLMNALAKLLHDFLAFYFEGLIGDKLQAIWKMTVGLCAPEENFYEMKKLAQKIKELPEYQEIFRLALFLMHSEQGSETYDLKGTYLAIDQFNSQFLINIKEVFLSGIKLFETFEKQTIEKASSELIEVLKKTEQILHAYIIQFPKNLKTFDSLKRV